MEKANFNMRICAAAKRIKLNRATIIALGNPRRLSIWYDEDNFQIMFSPAEDNELDTYEILPHFWKYTNQACVISQIALFQALQYRIGFENDSLYIYPGTIIKKNCFPAIIFDLAEGKRLQ
jgi:hypothetical protein